MRQNGALLSLEIRSASGSLEFPPYRKGILVVVLFLMNALNVAVLTAIEKRGVKESRIRQELASKARFAFLDQI